MQDAVSCTSNALYHLIHTAILKSRYYCLFITYEEMMHRELLLLASVAQMVKNLPVMQEAWVQSHAICCYHCDGSFSLFLLLFLLIPFYSFSFSDTAYKLAPGPTYILIIPGSGESPGEGTSKPLQYSCLGKPHGQRSLAGYSAWDRKELDMTEQLTHTQSWSSIHICLNLELPDYLRDQLSELGQLI